MKVAIFFTVLALVAAVSSVLTAKAEFEDKAEFVISNFKATWFKAMEYCHYLGLKLTKVLSAEDQLRIESAINETDKRIHTQFWIGGSDLGELMNFHWYSTGGRITWFNWFDVDNVYNNANDNSLGNCIYLDYPGSSGQWMWDLGTFNDTRYFICERNLS